MEFNLKKKTAGVLASVLDTVAEQPVDIDFVLPDYCPDIEKILKCKMTPKIYTRSLSGGQMQVEGTTVVTVLYVDGEKNSIRACQQSVPFSSTFPVKDVPECKIMETNAKPEYINCRALSPRRLSIHGAFSLYAKVLCKSMSELYSPDEGENLQCKSKDMPCTVLTSMGQDQFSAGDEITIKNKPPVEVILDSDVRASITDFRIIPDKVMVNGELSVKLLYLSNVEAGEPQQIDYIVPFSHILDSESIDEETMVTPSIDVMSYEVRLKSDMLSESPIVDVDAKLSLTALGYKIETIPVITDAYCTDFETELTSTQINISTDMTTVKDTFIQKDDISLENTKISSICDVSADYSQLSPVITSDGFILNGKINVCILAFDEEKKPVYIERSLEFSKNVDTESSFNSIEQATSGIISLSYRMGDNNNLELRTEIKYCVVLSKSESCSMIISVTADEEKRLPKRKCALTLYYAHEGESLWDIAKSYNTPCKRLVEENSLESEVLENSAMLLIPTL